ncbi:MAG TPA: site-specific integrase, partial [Gemmatales bacterium]|nr:site-specific integrase [Gemmatales bacterium]
MVLTILMTASLTKQSDSRKWQTTELLGKHVHKTLNNCSVSIVERNGKYMARGRHLRKQYCETLGGTRLEAESRLIELLSELTKGTFQPPQVQRKQFVQHRFVSHLTFSELLSQYITDVRKTKGRDTTKTYLARLGHIERFACEPGNAKQWPTVNSINRDFILKLKCQLQHATVTPNGHAHSIAKPMSQRQIFNVLSMLGTMFQWALRTDIRRLPAHWINPLTRELIGAKPTKDPIRRLTMNDEYLLQLIQHCDAWQLTHLALSFVYPLRPEEAVGLLVEEVDFSKRELRFGSRFGGDDYTKGKQSFVLPVPPELTPILSHLVNGRHHGPLLRQ